MIATMEFKEFLEEMMALYPHSFKDTIIGETEIKNRTQKIIKALKRVLGKINVDYNKLYNYVIEKNESNFLPDIVWFRQSAMKCLQDNGKPDFTIPVVKYKHVKFYHPYHKNICNTDCFASSVSDELIEKTYLKKFNNHPDFKIVEINLGY